MESALFPFLFITIACGAVSGFHGLISSGTTPKLLANQTDARFIGYGAMLMEPSWRLWRWLLRPSSNRVFTSR
ncbi:carbon starvation CstA family protein [Escherichia coli]